MKSNIFTSSALHDYESGSFLSITAKLCADTETAFGVQTFSVLNRYTKSDGLPGNLYHNKAQALEYRPDIAPIILVHGCDLNGTPQDWEVRTLVAIQEKKPWQVADILSCTEDQALEICKAQTFDEIRYFILKFKLPNQWLAQAGNALACFEDLEGMLFRDNGHRFQVPYLTPQQYLEFKAKEGNGWFSEHNTMVRKAKSDYDELRRFEHSLKTETLGKIALASLVCDVQTIALWASNCAANNLIVTKNQVSINYDESKPKYTKAQCTKIEAEIGRELPGLTICTNAA